jgi:tetratricopeptide (TPR) repeat protein
MLTSSLHFPSPPRDLSDPFYSPSVAHVVRGIYSRVAHSPSPTAAFAPVAEHLTALAGTSMSSHQRLQVTYLLAMACMACHQYQRAIAYLDEALDIAVHLEDLGACAELAYLQGSVHTDLQAFCAASEYYAASLDALHMLSESGHPVDADLELDLVIKIAAQQFLLQEYASSAQRLEEARRLIANLPAARLQAAAVSWIAALLSRWSGQPDRALLQAMAASEVYSTLGAPDAHGRILTVVADIALDLAGTFDTGNASLANEAFLELAEPYIRTSTALTRSAHDEAAEAMAALARVRYERASRQSTDRRHTIETITQAAQRLGDLPLLVQTRSALGDELASLGELEGSRQCYRNALDLLTNSDVPALGMWAQRALLRAAEMG